jgi:hypothetical protein
MEMALNYADEEVLDADDLEERKSAGNPNRQ